MPWQDSSTTVLQVAEEGVAAREGGVAAEGEEAEGVEGHSNAIACISLLGADARSFTVCLIIRGKGRIHFFMPQ